MRRSRREKIIAAFAPALAFGLTFHGIHVVMAQGTAAPAAPSTLPAAGTTSPVQTLTLQNVVTLAVNNNSSVVLARERLRNARYQLDATYAQARPQVTAEVLDTYDSLKTFGTSGGANVSSPTLPGGGTIPTITDQGGGTTTTFVGGGGGGTAASSGTTTAATSGTAPATTSGTNINAGVSGGGVTGAGGGTGTGTTGTGTASTGSASGSAVQMEDLPPIARRYAATVAAPVTGVAQPRGGTTGGSGGTGTTSGGTSTAGNTVGTGAVSSGNNGYHNNYSARGTITQYIDLFGFVPAALDVEKITLSFYQIDLQRIENETALAAKDDFFTVLRDQAQVSVDQEQVNAPAANLRITEVQYEAGTSAEANVLTAEVTLSNDQQTEISDQNTLSLAVTNLNNLLNIPADTQVSLQTPPLPPFTAAIDLQRSTQIALKQRPELVQARNNIEIANKLIRLAAAPLYPSLGISGTASYAGNSSPGTPNDDYTVTAQLNIPLYDGGYTHAEVQSAKVDLQTQLTTQAQLEQNVILEVRQSYLGILNDQAKGASAAVGTTNAREAARIAQLQYQYGTNTFLNVLNAQAQLATAETDELNAEYSYQTDLATLVRAIGGR